MARKEAAGNERFLVSSFFLSSFFFLPLFTIPPRLETPRQWRKEAKGKGRKWNNVAPRGMPRLLNHCRVSLERRIFFSLPFNGRARISPIRRYVSNNWNRTLLLPSVYHPTNSPTFNQNALTFPISRIRSAAFSPFHREFIRGLVANRGLRTTKVFRPKFFPSFFFFFFPSPRRGEKRKREREREKVAAA